MISAVLDTNTLASGTVTALTPPGQILNAWHAGLFELVTSEDILGELVRTLQKPYFQNHVGNTYQKVKLVAPIDFLELLSKQS